MKTFIECKSAVRDASFEDAAFRLSRRARGVAHPSGFLTPHVVEALHRGDDSWRR
jgi:hypothetical protein